jgi:YVTN family beta-propeller protein
MWLSHPMVPRHAYVTNAGSNSVSIIDTSTTAVGVTVPVGAQPVNAVVF